MKHHPPHWLHVHHLVHMQSAPPDWDGFWICLGLACLGLLVCVFGAFFPRGERWPMFLIGGLFAVIFGLFAVMSLTVWGF